ncbi:hypothetical protein F4677DRAFT_189918 [Hypoxylon crocopeplum]|nr:hypothetical protein F4677DRAFT_189918 [Hypoxylon crocopeplum]
MKIALLLATVLPFASGKTPNCNPGLGKYQNTGLAVSALIRLFLNSQWYGGDAPVVFGSVSSDDGILAEVSYACRDGSNPPSLLGEDIQKLWVSLVGLSCRSLD